MLFIEIGLGTCVALRPITLSGPKNAKWKEYLIKKGSRNKCFQIMLSIIKKLR